VLERMGHWTMVRTGERTESKLKPTGSNDVKKMADANTWWSNGKATWIVQK
jgi:hypothetical protein